MKLYDWEPTEATNGRKRYTDTSCIKLLDTNLKQQCSVCLIIKKNLKISVRKRKL